MNNTKQFFLSYDNQTDFDLKKLLRPVLTVSEVMPVKLLLKRMQQENVHIALLMDEYGGYLRDDYNRGYFGGNRWRNSR